MVRDVDGDASGKQRWFLNKLAKEHSISFDFSKIELKKGEASDAIKALQKGDTSVVLKFSKRATVTGSPEGVPTATKIIEKMVTVLKGRSFKNVELQEGVADLLEKAEAYRAHWSRSRNAS